MQVKFYASLRQAAGIKMMEVEFQEGMTIHDVLSMVTDQYPVLNNFIWREQGALSEHAHIFVNSQDIRHLAGLATVMKPKDRVDVFPPLVGG